MNFKKFSPKQRIAISWWLKKKFSSKDGIICDGAVRSGKTLCMSLGFVSWAMARFNGFCFAFCGKTITSVRRNLIEPLTDTLRAMGYTYEEKVSKNYLDIFAFGRKNRFYLFGGKDESSASLIQGMTLAGVLFDEVALMPRSFVEQAMARCSVTGSKMWFNCNPENPYHWFYREWIKKADEKNMLYLHFTMKDNPSLSPEIRGRYEKLYSGVFYERFVLGKWTAASGIVYPMFSEKEHTFDSPPECGRFVVSCDYGTVNPSSFGLWGESGGVWYRLEEYYYDSRKEGVSRTDEEHYSALEKLIGDRKPEMVIVDPSAASFIECIHRHGKFLVTPAKNDVLSGVRRVGDALKSKSILISKNCTDCLREFTLYRWNEKAGGDIPVKENDHAMDDLRYFVSTALNCCADDFFVASVAR